MIRADSLKSMIDSCSKVHLKADDPIVGLKVEDGHVEVFSQGQTSAMRLSDAIEGPHGNFSCGFHQSNISKILGGCGPSVVTLKLVDNKLTIGGIINAKTATVEKPPDLKIDTESKFLVPVDWFKRCAILTGKFAAKDATRYVFNTGHFEFVDGVASFCATDSRKVVWSETKCSKVSGPDYPAINIPRESMAVIASILPPLDNVEAMIHCGQTGFGVEIGGIVYWCLQAEGRFPEHWRDVPPRPKQMSTIDGKRLSKFSDVLSAVGVQRAKFVSDGSSLKIYGASSLVEEIDTNLDTAIDPGTMTLDPELLAGAAFENAMFQFGWGYIGESREGAVFVSSPFTAACMKMEDDSDLT